MLISLLASSSTSATSSSDRSKGVSIVWIIHNYICALYGQTVGIQEHLPIISIDEDDLVVRGDADDLAGGKIGRLGNETRDPGMTVPGGSDNMVTVTE